MPRKAAGPRKLTTKQAARAVQKDERARLKNERIFANAVQQSRSSILDDDYRYIESTLSQNPSWISPLAGLIRSGSLNGLLRESFDDPRAAAGERWKGKCTKFSQLPFDMVVHMLRQTGVQLSDDVVRSEDVVRQLFMAQFWLADTVCLPKTSPDIRFVSSLGKIAKMRLDHLGRNWLAAHARAGPITEGKKETFRLWEIKNDELVCRAFTLDNDGRVASAPTQSSCTSVPLPVLQSDEWRLSDPYAPNCRVYAAQGKGKQFDFSAFSFFDVLLPPDARWQYDLQAEQDAEHADHSTENQSTTGA